ncbi:MAG: undecaprenyl/decaprenyl-phosphate alpha-N-acetylglucosaminyl 1-phosphate transferase [Cytophagales bacterium]|nr:undecaprenyl/decaprenyl-phosphate alpha-N-acetylglucosaminyl 1-phosphate transferase [Cytophagales bacterium]
MALLLAFLWALLISVFAIPSITYVAHVKKLLDKPGKRTLHESLTPRLGGLAIFAGFMSALTIFCDLSNGVQQVLAGCIVIFFIGLKDDLVTVAAFKKFFVQVLAAGIVMFMADIRITNFYGIFGIHELEIGISYAFTFFVIIGITNSFNLLDGLDGLAGIIALIVAATFGIYFYIYDDSVYAGVAFCLAGGVLGFLRYNLYKAIVFMGDSGSLICGFIISVLAIRFIAMNAVPSSPAIAVAILIIPIFDTSRVFILRILSGRSPFIPDKNHIHHRIVAYGCPQLFTIIILTLLNLIIIAITIYLSKIGNIRLLIFLISISLLLGIIIEVIGKFKKIKNT